MSRPRHPSVDSVTRFFEFEHLPVALKSIAAACADLKDFMLVKLEDDPELTAGLRKLLEAKDCFVRAAVAQENRATGETQGKPIK